MNITKAQIKSQFTRVKRDGWLELFKRAAEQHGHTVALLLAIGSRETNLKNIKGDFRGGVYHGFGVMQVDIGTDLTFTQRWSPANPEPAIMRGGEILAEKRRDAEKNIGKRVSVKGHSYTITSADADDVRRMSVAGYNAGRWPQYHFARGENMDSTTTGKDYSRDVYDRAVVFAMLLDESGDDNEALVREVKLQGKYARDEHRALANMPSRSLTGDRAPASVKVEPRAAETELARVDYARETEVESDHDSTATTGNVGGNAGGGIGGTIATIEGKPVDGGGAGDAPVEVAATGVEKSGSRKSIIATLGAGLTALGVSAGSVWEYTTEAFKANPVLILLVLGIIGAVVLIYWKYQDRQTKLDIVREQHAHEVNKLKLTIAADPSRINVELKPNVVPAPPPADEVASE